MKKNDSQMQPISFAFVIIMMLLFICPLISADAVYASGAYLTWNANSEETLAGYKVYYKLNAGGEPYNGTGANEGSSPVTVYLAQLDDPDSPSFSLTGLEAGQTYFFSVKAFGTEGGESDYSDPTSLTLSGAVGNLAPQANAGSDQTVPGMQTVTLDGSGSSDPDGEVTGYEWTQLSGPTVSLSNAFDANPFFEAPPSGSEGTTLTFSLQVTDSGGLTDSDTCTVTVAPANEVPENSAPRADAGTDQTAPAGQVVYLDGTGSSDPDGELAGYEWTQLDGPKVSIASASEARSFFEAPFVGTEGATLAFLLTVSDAGGLTNSDICTVTVTYANEAPVASAGPDRTAIPSEVVTLDGTGSSDPDNGIATYSWAQKQGAAVTLIQAETSTPKFKVPKTAAAGSQFVFELTVADRNGLESTDSCVVTVVSSYSIDEGTGTGSDPQETESDPDVAPGEETTTTPDTSTDVPEETEPETSTPEETTPTGGTETTPEDTTGDVDETFDGNHVPVFPIAVDSGSGSTAVMPVQLALKNFYDPDQGDYHLKTQWQIFRNDDNVCVLSTISTEFLTTFTVPDIVFDENTNYRWKARFFDNRGAVSPWSTPADIMIGSFETDENDDGVPDEQAVDSSVDLNRDGLPDAEQVIMKSIVIPAGNKSVGLSIENSDTVTSILSLEAVDPVAANFSPDDEAKANQLPYGLINVKLGVENPGDTASVTVYFDASLPSDAGWMKFDPVRSLWFDYSDHAQFSPDRMSVELEFVDGGFGDDDGVANGIIVDPSGPGLTFTADAIEPSASTPTVSLNETESTDTTGTAGTEDATADAGGSGGGGGCFISGAAGEEPISPLAAPILLLIGLGLLGMLRRIKKQ